MSKKPNDRLWLTDRQTRALKLAAKTHPLHLHKIAYLKRIPQIMRQHCSKPGDDFAKCMTVWLDPGEIIDWHEHQRHVVLYYPAALSTDPVIELPSGLYHPLAGSFLYLPPNTLHKVPKHAHKRLSVAMVIEK